MADSTHAAPKIETPTSADEVPGGIPLDGMSADEAAQGLFDALADEFEDESENEESEQSTPPGGDPDEEGDDEFEDDDLDDLGDEDDKDEFEDESESDDGENEEESGEDLYEVTLPGGEKAQVTLEELQAGYSRTEDYTRKRQRDASEHAEAMTEVRAMRDSYAERLEKLNETLQSLGPQEPSQALRRSNPGEYAAQMAEYQAYQDTLGQIGQAQNAISAEQQAEINAARQAHVHAEWEKVVAAIPTWANQDTALQELAQLRKYAIDDLRFTAEEIDSLADHRLMLMLKENYDLKQKRTRGKKVVETKRKSSKRLRPGAAQKTPRARGKEARRQQRSADQLAAQTGSVRDAARAIEMLLD